MINIFVKNNVNTSGIKKPGFKKKIITLLVEV